MYAPAGPAEQKFPAGRRGRTHLWFHFGLTCSQMQYSPHQSSSALMPHSLCRDRKSLNLKFRLRLLEIIINGSKLLLLCHFWNLDSLMLPGHEVKHQK